MIAMGGELRAALERAEAEHAGEGEGWFHMFLATLGGAAAVVLSFAPWNFFPLAFLALIPVLSVTRHVSDAKVFRRAWLFGILTNIGGFPWVVGLVVKFGGMPPVIGVFLLLLLAMHQGLVPAIAFWLARKVERGFGWRHGYALAATYVFAEFLVPIIFPWRLGHSQVYHLAFLQLAELGGVHLMTFVVVLVNVALFDWIRRIRAARVHGSHPTPAIVYLTIALFLAVEIFGVLRIRSVERAQKDLPTLRVGLVEGDIEIEDKWNPNLYAKNLYTYQKLSAEAVEQGAELVVWPESAYNQSIYHFQTSEGGPIERSRVIPHDVHRMLTSQEPLGNTASADARKVIPPAIRNAAQRGFEAPLLTGTTIFRETTEEERKSLPPRRTGEQRTHLEFNSSILLDQEGRVQGMAHKYTLMPISERIPGADFVWQTFGINLYQIVPESGLFGRGDGPTVLEHQQKQEGAHDHRTVRIGILNCYEDLMPGFVRKMGKQTPDFLLNQSNDAWFGRYIEPDQHMALAVPRAVEARTWLVRSTNTGVSSFIDASGRVRDRTSVVDAEILVRDVPLKPSAMTPYRVLGEWVVALAAILVGAGLLRRFRQRRLMSAAS